MLVDLILILQKLLSELLKKLDSELKHEVCHWAAYYVSIFCPRKLLLLLRECMMLLGYHRASIFVLFPVFKCCGVSLSVSTKAIGYIWCEVVFCERMCPPSC